MPLIEKMDNIEERMENASDGFADEAPDCPTCDSPTRLTDGKRGLFWGCTRFPICRASKSIRKDEYDDVQSRWDEAMVKSK